MLQRRFKDRSPKDTLKISIHGFYQNLAEHFCDIRSIHNAIEAIGRLWPADLATANGPTNKWLSDVPLRVLHEALKITRNLVGLLDFRSTA
jgi:hypothetical protein